MQNENPGVQACHYAFSVLETKRLPLLFSWKVTGIQVRCCCMFEAKDAIQVVFVERTSSKCFFYYRIVNKKIPKRKDSGGRSLCDQQAESVASLLARRRKEEGKKR